MGDWRSGQELLDQADLDYRTGLGHAWKQHGQSLMQYMSWKCRALEELLARPHGQEGPASPRCIRPSDPSFLLSDDTAGLACPSHIPARWARGPLLHLWALGYRDELAALLDALPPALLRPLCCALDARDRLDGRRRAALRVAHGAVAAAAGCSGAGGDAGGGGADGMGDPGGLWEAEAEAGFLSVGYDGATGRRLCVGMNRRQAELMGARRGEALRRIAAYAVPLAAPQADVLACLAHELDRPAQVRRSEPGQGRLPSPWPPSFPAPLCQMSATVWQGGPPISLPHSDSPSLHRLAAALPSASFLSSRGQCGRPSAAPLARRDTALAPLRGSEIEPTPPARKSRGMPP